MDKDKIVSNFAEFVDEYMANESKLMTKGCGPLGPNGSLALFDNKTLLSEVVWRLSV